MKWSSLVFLTRNKILGTSFYWVALVPILAKGTRTINSIDLHWLCTTCQFSTQLPFNWKVLYFSALSLFLSRIIFLVKCPKLILSFSNFREFQDSGRGVSNLKDELIAARSLNLISEDQASKFLTDYCINSGTGDNALERLTECTIHSHSFADAFYNVLNMYERCNHPYLVAASVIFYIGCILGLFVIANSTATVISIL